MTFTYEELLLATAVFSYVVRERPEGETIPELSRRFTPIASAEGMAVERIVRDFVGSGFLRIGAGKVQPNCPAPAPMEAQ